MDGWMDGWMDEWSNEATMGYAIDGLLQPHLYFRYRYSSQQSTTLATIWLRKHRREQKSFIESREIKWNMKN